MRAPRQAIAGFWWVLAAPFLIPAARAAGEWNFRTQIVPILSKAGCNAGACHGAASGQAGFHLSLLGYDPEEDFWSITRELAGRRIDLDSPAESLVLRKPSRQLPHDGGRRLPRDAEGYQTLLHWIKAGAPFGSPDLRVTGITVEPAEQLLSDIGSEVQLKVTASFSDGSKQDASNLALFSSNDDSLAEVDGTGRVTIRGRGLTSIMVRYSGQVSAARLVIPFAQAPATGAFPPRNFIDEEVGAELERLRIPASPLSDDAEFLRRVYLDITGRLPAPEEARRWLASDPTPADRERVTDSLFQTESFVDFWTLQFGDLFLISGKRGSEQATQAYSDWLRKQIAQNVAWDQMARALLMGHGDVTRDGPANFLNLANDPRDLAEYASSIFLGTQLGCARCHAHPNDRWTRDDYGQFAAFFAQVDRQGTVIRRNAQGTLEHPKTKTVLTPKLLGDREISSVAIDPREVLAEWVTQPRNPFFGRALVNRVWKHFLGRGLVEPVNDLRPTNPATHPRLLDRLAESFATNHFDLRWLIRTITASRTYQLSCRPTQANAADDRFYSHGRLKALPAQVLIDAIVEVTGVAEIYEGLPKGTRATALIGSQTPSYALDVLGRCRRERTCEPAGHGGGLAQALHLINGTTINTKLAGGTLSAMLAASHSNREIIEEFFWRAFARPPTASELDFWEANFQAIGNRTEAAEDFVWTLLNSREFAFNH